MSELNILRETVLVEIPRGDDVLRVTFTEAQGDRGPISWHSLRVFYRPKGSDDWLPGKAGLTIRAREVDAVARALRQTTSPTPAPQPSGAATQSALPAVRGGSAGQHSESRASDVLGQPRASDEDIPF